MISICPTVTAEGPVQYQRQMETVEPLSTRLHVDVSDGVLAPRKLLSLDNIWWRGNRTIDLHMMYQRPFEHKEIVLAMSPRLVIVHAEAEGNFFNFAKLLHEHGMEVGVALLPGTPAESILKALPIIDHVLIFSGRLGFQGGSNADLKLLEKVKTLRKHKPTVEIGWDGGVNDKNMLELVEGGIDVCNVGGFIANAEDPGRAYATLKALAST